MARIPTFTKEEYQDIAASIEDGSYFENARRWYSIVYMSIMPERCHYIVFTAIAAMAGLLALLSLLQLLPIVSTKPVLLPMKNVAQTVPIVTPLRSSHGQSVNNAFQQYFITQYVLKREGYSFEQIQENFRFLNNYSSNQVTNSYRRFIDPNSPRSPINRFERNAEREIEIADIVIRRADGQPEIWAEESLYLAEISFIARVVTKSGKTEYNYWKSKLEFEYTPLKMIQPEDNKTGKLQVSPMEFTVTDYTVIEILPDQRR